MHKDIADAFQVLLSDPGEWRANFQGLNFSRISDLEATSLELHFSIEEVFATLSDFVKDMIFIFVKNKKRELEERIPCVFH